jgi:two-component system cell cycle sensor histidine kinase/response regulator CckA
MSPQDFSGQASSNLGPADSRRRSAGIGLVILVAFAVVSAALGLMLIGRANSGPYILALLAVLAMVGVFALFALSGGILRFAGAETETPLLKSVAEESVDGLMVADHRSGRVLYANAAYRALFNAAEARDVRSIEQVLVHDPDVSQVIYRMLNAAQEGRRVQEEVRVIGLKGGPSKWLRLRAQPLRDPQHDALLTLWTVTDITRERERYEGIFQNLQYAIDFLDHAPAGFFSVDASGAVTYLNATLASWLDHDLAQVGSGGLQLQDIVSGEGAALLTTLSGTPGEVKTEIFDLDLKTRGGRSLPARLYHKVGFDADGVAGPSRTLVLNRARGQADDAQRAAEVRFMRFFQNTPMAIATVDKTARIARANARFARMFEGLGKETEERSILTVVAERDRGALEAAIRSAAEGCSDIAPVDAALAGSSERFGRFYVTAVEEQERDGEAAIVYVLDVTEQRSLEKQFAQSQKMQAVGQLAGGIAHDFNNVLNAIILAADFLLSAHKPTDPAFQDIMQIKQNANRAASLVRQLLAFSRRQTLRPQVVDLRETLDDLKNLLGRLIGEKVVLTVEHARDLWPVKADISQLEQVIVNLAVNARDAMPDGGKLTLRTANVSAADSAQYGYKGMQTADYVLIEVIDTGTGIPPEIIDKIFEPFFSTKEVGKGTGLGLSTVYGIIKQTGGYIYPESEPGRGTTFRIFLPRYVPSKPETIEPPAEPEISGVATALGAVAEKVPLAPDLTGQGTILLVEDEQGLRGLNARGLASRGYQVLEAANGVEAIEVFERHGGKVDVVVSDVVMPEMDGPTLLKELRRRNPHVKIIFVSGYAEEAFDRSLPAGEQFSFLPKPFTLKQLVAAVKETMSS